jgi:CheY-like chemotaxis protein
VEEADDGAAGLAMLLGDGKVYDLILTDLKMPPDIRHRAA